MSPAPALQPGERATMRAVLACLAALGLLIAWPNANATTPDASAVSGVYMAGGEPAALTDVTAHKDDPFGGQPVTALVFTVAPQGDDVDADSDAHNGKFGDALVVRVQPDGRIIGVDMLHHGLVKTDGYITAVGVLSLQDYQVAGGEISGHLTSGGRVDAWGQQINVDLTFHVRAP
jgi:hypothetical protein